MLRVLQPLSLSPPPPPALTTPVYPPSLSPPRLPTLPHNPNPNPHHLNHHHRMTPSSSPPPPMHALLPAFLRIWGQYQNQPLAGRFRAIHRLYSVMFKICLKQNQILPKDTKKLCRVQRLHYFYLLVIRKN